MFRSILECEVSLKEKVVDDFIANLKPNPLDYNLTTHTMKLKTDYLLLVRKLYGYLLHWNILKLEKDEPKVDKPQETHAEPKRQIPEERRCNLKVSITSANNVKNPGNENTPPNTYICFKNPFGTEEVELRTPVVYRTTFPQWDYEHEIKGVPISEICNFVLKHPLEFEVYHKKLPAEGAYLNQESILVGRAYVDASNLVKDPEEMSVSGYYHIFKNREDRDLDDYNVTKQVTQGQIKLQLKVNKPLLSEFDIQNTEKKQHQVIMKNLLREETKRREEEDIEDENPLQKAIRKAKELRAKRQDEKDRDTVTHLRRVSRSPERQVRRNQENEDANLLTTSITELRVRRDQNFKELTDMTLRLKHSLSEQRDDPFDDVLQEDNEDDLARATNQNIESSL